MKPCFRLPMPTGVRSSWSLVLALCCCVALSSPALAEQDLDETRQELEAIQQRIGQTTRTLEEKKQAERTAAADLDRVEQTLKRLGGRVITLGQKLESLEREIGAIEGEIGQTGTQMSTLRGRVGERLAAMYKAGDARLAGSLFSGRTLAEREVDSLCWNRIVAHDHELLRSYRRQLDTQQRNLLQLAALRGEQQRLLNEQQRQQEEMRTAARVKQQLLTRVRSDRKALSGELSDLRERAERINTLLKRLEASRRRESGAGDTTRFAEQKGRLRWPVEGKIRIPFGSGRHPDLKTQYQSQGLELEVATPRQVRAVWPGKVVYASWFKGYGNLLIVDHGDGYYTLYGQLAKAGHQVGEQLQKGQTIATTDGRDGRLYFEIRKGGVPLDPEDWLEPK